MKKKNLKFLKYIILNIVIASVTVVILMNFVFSIYQINGYSMHPTLKSKSKVILYKLISKNRLKRYNIVVFSDPLHHNEFVIKRIIGLPGENLSIKKGQVFINNKKIPEPYILESSTNFAKLENKNQILIKKNHFFLMGDNRTISNDSRDFGPISKESIYGKVILCYWPPAEMCTL